MIETAQGSEVEDEDDDSATTQTCNESIVVQKDGMVTNQEAKVPIEGIVVTATSPNDDAVTTITESIVSHTDEIEKDYFFNTKGLLKKPNASEDPLWAERKEKVREAIDSILKDKMTVEAQRLGLCINHEGVDVTVTNFREIGCAWRRIPFDLDRAGIVNSVMNVQFDTDKAYEFYIERDIMKNLNIDYIKGVKGKGDIAKMVTRRKAELVKNLNYRGATTHGFKISKIRSRKQVELEGKRKPKKKAAFQVFSGDNGGKWYKADGEEYSSSPTSNTKQVTADKELLIKIRTLEQQLAKNEKVLSLYDNTVLIYYKYLTLSFSLFNRKRR